eukprot:13769-Eustigmatos_ZCMA.PRE.1
MNGGGGGGAGAVAVGGGDHPLAKVCLSESVYVGSAEKREPVRLSANVREWAVDEVVTWLCQFEPLRSKAYVQ